MAYEVLARKYRPQRFSDLVGQEHIARTLAQAIERDRVAHAFLFTGVRGVGKTSSARIMAKALNCLVKMSPEPCNECEACVQITAGHDNDVFEIDGASNNSVDDVRKLQELLPYSPQRDRFRIVIIDEVHMLSTGAFNALLKTLEEPPPHVKFIFATTELQKVPITVRSRCQRFDFRLITEPQLMARLKQILDLEKIASDESALRVIAREAAGSMRDALTLLDQVIAYHPEGVFHDKVLEVLGIAGEPSVLRAAFAVLEGNAPEVFATVEEISSKGSDLLHFAKQLQTLLRDLTYARVTGDINVALELSVEAMQSALERIKDVDTLSIERAFFSLGTVIDELARSLSPRISLEMGLVYLATRPPLKDLSKVLSELQSLKGGGGGSRPTAPQVPPAPRSPSAPIVQSTSARTAAEKVPAPLKAVSAPPVALARAEKTVASNPSPVASAPDLAPVESLEHASEWERIVAAVRERRPALAAVLEYGSATWPNEPTLDELVISFPEGSFYARQADVPDVRSEIAEVAARIAGREVKVRVGAAKEPVLKETLAQKKISEREGLRDLHTKAALSHPAVRDLLDVFPEAASSVEVSVNLDD